MSTHKIAMADKALLNFCAKFSKQPSKTSANDIETLPSLEEQREQTVLRVEDAMKAAPTPILNGGDSVDQALQRIQDLPGDFLVRLNPSGWRSMTADTLKRLVGEGKGEMTLGSALVTPALPYLHPDHTLETALRYVYEVPFVPVVHRADFGQLEGVISRDEALEKYRMAQRT